MSGAERWRIPSRIPARLQPGLHRGRVSMRARRARLNARRFQIAQCAGAAGVAWLLAHELLGHKSPVFAAVAAIVSLGTSYGQRLRRVAEVTLGVALGVLLGDLLVLAFGVGPVQIGVIVALGMSIALFLDGGQIFLNQAAVQGVFVTALVPSASAAWTRWTDALVGGAVALLAAAIVPAAPLRRPREQAAVVVGKISTLLRAAADVIRDADAVHGMAVLADARSTDPLVRELQAAADEGISVVASSPFRIRHREQVRAMSELIEPLDRALRSTRVLVRQVAVAAYRGQPVPEEYADLALALAEATDQLGAELKANRMASAVRPRLVELGERSSTLPRSAVLNAEGVLLQLRSVIVDLLQMTGMGPFEATDALPPF
ncbi:MAG: FUSC family protein [Nocardioides sp.]|uniref:FUSC family protein n=1 Tax=Nocardioides nematodiphilus TaxID=2849669 RepID=UPI001CDA4C2B|nr:FUSC family protein [Nocardioides nematodiphilus]MCA1983136.1 FUSC family protein [Nocardioides nematodiphilus]